MLLITIKRIIGGDNQQQKIKRCHKERQRYFNKSYYNQYVIENKRGMLFK